MTNNYEDEEIKRLHDHVNELLEKNAILSNQYLDLSNNLYTPLLNLKEKYEKEKNNLITEKTILEGQIKTKSTIIKSLEKDKLFLEKNLEQFEFLNKKLFAENENFKSQLEECNEIINEFTNLEENNKVNNEKIIELENLLEESKNKEFYYFQENEKLQNFIENYEKSVSNENYDDNKIRSLSFNELFEKNEISKTQIWEILQKNSDLKVNMNEIQRKIDELESEYLQFKKESAEKIEKLKIKKNYFKSEWIKSKGEIEELKENYENLVENYNKVEKACQEMANNYKIDEENEILNEFKEDNV